MEFGRPWTKLWGRIRANVRVWKRSRDVIGQKQGFNEPHITFLQASAISLSLFYPWSCICTAAALFHVYLGIQRVGSLWWTTFSRFQVQTHRCLPSEFFSLFHSKLIPLENTDNTHPDPGLSLSYKFKWFETG